MAGGIAEVTYGVPYHISHQIHKLLPYSFKNLIFKYYNKVFDNMKVPTRIHYKGQVVQTLDLPPINCAMYGAYSFNGCEHVITDIEILLDKPQAPEWDITIVDRGVFKKENRENKELRTVKLPAMKVDKPQVIAPVTNPIHY